ncbi:hypothetical protein RDI58_017683 [Solanum bulbocastanum]|uniref:Uncharacterized protein n=1 Tax=Solanum bulbocastanum TaxID=147425 RepID=A0AAN8TAA6_SOLBU
MVHPLSIPMVSNPLFMPTELNNNVQQPIMVPKSNKDHPSKIPRDHGYTFEEALRIPSSYPNTHQYSSSIQVDKTIKNEEHEEMTRKMKSLEQNRSSLANIRKKTTENFHEYVVRWRE